MQRWLGRFAFVAGIAAAIAMAQLIPRFADLSRVDFLRGPHAVIAGWPALATSIGAALGQPQFGRDVALVLLFAAFVAIPGAILFAYSPPSERWAAIDFQEYRRRMMAHHGAWAPLRKAVQAVGLAFIFLALYAGAVAPDLLSGLSGGKVTFGESLFALLFAAFTVGVAYLFALGKLRGYFTGFVLVLGLMVVLQALYWLDVPWVSDQVRLLAAPAQS